MFPRRWSSCVILAESVIIRTKVLRKTMWQRRFTWDSASWMNLPRSWKGRRVHSGVHNLGHTRSVRRASYLLQTPDTFVRTKIPGTSRANVIVHISPAMGAGFTQYTVEFEPGGVLGPAAGQRFVYIPQGVEQRVSAVEIARAVVIEQPYRDAEGIGAPEFLVGREPEVVSQ